jgi:hypothetical protein
MWKSGQVRVVRSAVVTQHRLADADILITVGELDWAVTLNGNCLGDL